MTFWSNATLEAKRNYRFKITMNAFGDQSLMWWAKTVTLPSYEVSETEHNHMDNKYYFPGRVSWSTVAMTLVDPISPDAAKLLNDMLVTAGYIVPADANTGAKKPTLSKNKANANGLGVVKIDVLNADGESVESWELKNTFIQAASFGSLDYSNDDLKELELTMRYDWAECTTGVAGAGGTVFKPQTV
tara:strand:+ start:579 stop:1142 length:564 start_codon:yes stop_codon:yes gene_type:complete